eukprot:scaffold1192_cov153-Pinguiococcus_pyrenoidosus.AAC.1
MEHLGVDSLLPAVFWRPTVSVTEQDGRSCVRSFARVDWRSRQRAPDGRKQSRHGKRAVHENSRRQGNCAMLGNVHRLGDVAVPLVGCRSR